MYCKGHRHCSRKYYTTRGMNYIIHTSAFISLLYTIIKSVNDIIFKKSYITTGSINRLTFAVII
jgi:hypothetical protein